MDKLIEILVTRGQHLLGRFDGPLHFRLIVMPLVVSVLAIRAGLRDVREGQPSFFPAIFSNPTGRQRALRSAIADIGKAFCMALVLDTIYQLTVLRWIYPGELLLVAVACAIVPYLVIRGAVTLLTRRLYQNQVK